MIVVNPVSVHLSLQFIMCMKQIKLETSGTHARWVERCSQIWSMSGIINL
jgi:hypothetical protein